MAEKVLLILHTDSSDPGRVETALCAAGHVTARLCPRAGDVLPEDHASYAGSVIFGGPQSVSHAKLRPYLRAEMDWMERSLGAGKPLFGICLGAQMLARLHGARVAPHPEGRRQIGYFPIVPTPAGRGLFAEGLCVYHWHSDGFELPRGAELLATGPTFPNQAFRLGERAYGVQFHPDVTGEIMGRWIEAGSKEGDLDLDGAQSGDRQEALRRRHEPGMQAWLDDFIAAWLGPARPALRETGE